MNENVERHHHDRARLECPSLDEAGHPFMSGIELVICLLGTTVSHNPKHNAAA